MICFSESLLLIIEDQGLIQISLTLTNLLSTDNITIKIITTDGTAVGKLINSSEQLHSKYCGFQSH